MPFFVLVHSPSVGPATWLPVADRLSELGYGVAVPSLLGVADNGPPYWPKVVAAVKAGLGDTGLGDTGLGDTGLGDTGLGDAGLGDAGLGDAGLASAGSADPADPADSADPLVLVVHSNAGVFVPVIVAGLSRPVACVVFADAAIPGSGGSTPMAPEELLPFLRGLADPDGRLPPWTDWWDEQDVAPMFPDAQSRQVIAAEQPRLPFDYYLEQVPAPVGWDDGRRCAYLLFSHAYDESLIEARRRGWPALSVPGEHLHQVVDPDAVTQAILELAGTAR